MNSAEQDDVCTGLAQAMAGLFLGQTAAAGSQEREDLIDQARQLVHEAMFRASYNGCQRCAHGHGHGGEEKSAS